MTDEVIEINTILLIPTGTSESSSSEDTGSESECEVQIPNEVQTGTEVIDMPSTSVSTGQLPGLDTGVQNILSLLGNVIPSNSGPEVNADVAALMAGYVQKGIQKEDRNKMLETYPLIRNCQALQPPEVNPEIKACLEANTLKQDSYLNKLQLQLAAGISALAVPFSTHYEHTRDNPSEESRKQLEKLCDPIKLFGDVFHALSSHRRFAILPQLDGGIKKILEDCPIDKFLFGENFTEKLKCAKEAERLGSALKKKTNHPQPVGKFPNKRGLATRPGPSGKQSLNSRGPHPRARMKKEEGRPGQRRIYRRQ